MSLLSILTFLILFHIYVVPTFSRSPHVISFRSPNLYPEAVTWDPSAQHFLVGSLRNRSIVSVSDAGVAQTLISDPDLPPNSSILGIALDPLRHRLLAAVQSMDPLPPFHALASYDLPSRRRLSLTPLPSATDERQIANDVVADFDGNAYVTNSAGNYIWKVNKEGEASIFSKSPLYAAHPVVADAVYSFCGLNGVAYVSKGYLLVVQSNTGKMFKVDAVDGTARLVLLNEDLLGADGIAVRSDDVVLVVSATKLWFLKSQDSWGEGVVFDKIDLDEKRFATSVTVGAENRVYVLYGHVDEGMMGNAERERFSIEEMRSERESGEENVWVYVLVGLGLAYFMFWRFQMGQLVKNLDKKIN